jgi:hypothetical protein
MAMVRRFGESLPESGNFRLCRRESPSLFLYHPPQTRHLSFSGLTAPHLKRKLFTKRSDQRWVGPGLVIPEPLHVLGPGQRPLGLKAELWATVHLRNTKQPFDRPSVNGVREVVLALGVERVGRGNVLVSEAELVRNGEPPRARGGRSRHCVQGQFVTYRDQTSQLGKSTLALGTGVGEITEHVSEGP